MNYKFDTNIRVLYDLQRLSTWVKESFQHGKEDLKWAVNIVKDVGMIDNLKLMWETKERISSAENSKNPIVKQTLELLKVTGIIEEWIISSARILKRFGEGSGRSGAIAIIKALDSAENGSVQIVTYAGNNYKTQSLDEYRNEVKQNPEKVNIWAIPWLVKLQEQWKFDLSLWTETWENISIYCANKNWNTKIISNNNEVNTFMKKMYTGKKAKEEQNLKNIFDTLIPGIEKNDPRLAELLLKTNLEKNPNGTINATKAIEKMNITNINQVPGEFQKIADTMKNEANKLFQKAREIAKSIPVKSLSELDIPWIKKWEILNKPLETFSETEIKQYLPILRNYIQTTKDPKQIENVQSINKIFTSRLRWFEIARISADAQLKVQSTQKEILKNPNITLQELWENLNSQIEQEKAILAQEIIVSRISSDDHLDILKSNWINNLELAQKKLTELEKKWNLTKEDVILKSILVWYIQSKIHEAQVYKNYGNNLSEVEKREIFVQTNQYISNNPKEIYDFKALEKIAILSDPESTPSEKKLARMEPGETIPIAQLMEWNMQSSLINAPEISNMNLIVNSNGTYNIPLLKENNLSKPQVQECLIDIGLYADLWLSQFIPHIPMITDELRKKWINTNIDGNTGTMEQQQVLKAIYSLLYWKNIETTNLYDVERAFVSSAGNPSNMKNAMQHTLSVHHLIASPGQAIAPDTLQNWIRWNLDFSSPSINPITTT